MKDKIIPLKIGFEHLGISLKDGDIIHGKYCQYDIHMDESVGVKYYLITDEDEKIEIDYMSSIIIHFDDEFKCIKLTKTHREETIEDINEYAKWIRKYENADRKTKDIMMNESKIY